MAHYGSKVWGGKGVGWLKKQEEKDAQYENMGEGWPLLIALFRFWPDFLADTLWADDAPYDLALIQRMILRVNARYRDVDITGCRGVTKSFCTDLGAYLDMLLWPGTITGVFGPSLKQTTGISKKIWEQIGLCSPILQDMLILDRNGADVFSVTTPFGSAFSIEQFRGNSMHHVIAEETTQEDKRGVFDVDEFKEAVIPQVRLDYRVGRAKDPAYIRFKQHSITSAGRQQCYAFETRKRHLVDMMRGKSAFVMDIPIAVVLLCQMRGPEWAEKQIEEVGVSAVPRELESIYSGSDRFPLIPDDVLDSSRSLLLAENHHCCRDRDNRLKPEDVIYIMGYDVSYRDSKVNAKCAVVILKCTRQSDTYHRDKYLKRVVWVEDWFPSETPTPIAQAQRIRRIWDRYTYEGSESYIAIDAWQYGDGVLAALMSETPGGGVPLCVYRHREKTELELEGAIPVIYPIRAGGVGVLDPDSDMIKNAQMQFLHSNVQLLTSNMNDGVEAYKDAHRIKDDSLNYQIAIPYKNTQSLVRQIQNLREHATGTGLIEKRISKSVQRDSWSALKYAMRFAEILERSRLQKRKRKSDWQIAIEQFGRLGARTPRNSGTQRLITPRSVGRKF